VSDTDDEGTETVGNTVGVPRRVLDYIATALVDEPDEIRIDEEARGDSVDLRLSVSKEDMGRVIGRRGRVAQAIRTIVRAAGAREGVEASVDIVD
jgi:predicted RNA-binding protein YlqC (UPF0109 family)